MVEVTIWVHNITWITYTAVGLILLSFVFLISALTSRELPSETENLKPTAIFKIISFNNVQPIWLQQFEIQRYKNFFQLMNIYQSILELLRSI